MAKILCVLAITLLCGCATEPLTTLPATNPASPAAQESSMPSAPSRLTGDEPTQKTASLLDSHANH